MKGKSSKRTLKLSISQVSIAVLLLSMTFTFLAVVLVVAQEPVEVRVSVPEEEVEEGEPFVVTIDVDSITNLSSGQFDLSFDPAVVKVSDVNDGEINGEDVPIFMWDDTDEDTVKVFIMIMPMGEVVSGSGYLAEIEFDAVGEAGAESVLDISNGVLTTIGKGVGKYEEPEEIPANWINATIRIGGEEEEEEEEEDEEPTPSPSLTPTPTLAPGETPGPTPSPTLAPGETPSPTPTLAPGVTPAATPTLAPGITPTKKPAAKAKATPTPTPTPKPAGFEVIFAIVVVLVIAYVMRKIKK